MRNYETLKNSMTVERMAEMGVRLVSLNNRELYYMTSTGQLYTMGDYNAALQHEYNWLMHDPDTTKIQGDTEGSNETSDKTVENNKEAE